MKEIILIQDIGKESNKEYLMQLFNAKINKEKASRIAIMAWRCVFVYNLRTSMRRL
jgi:hypothetical protein